MDFKIHLSCKYQRNIRSSNYNECIKNQKSILCSYENNCSNLLSFMSSMQLSYSNSFPSQYQSINYHSTNNTCFYHYMYSLLFQMYVTNPSVNNLVLTDWVYHIPHGLQLPIYQQLSLEHLWIKQKYIWSGKKLKNTKIPTKNCKRNKPLQCFMSLII